MPWSDGTIANTIHTHTTHNHFRFQCRFAEHTRRLCACAYFTDEYCCKIVKSIFAHTFAIRYGECQRRVSLTKIPKYIDRRQAGSMAFNVVLSSLQNLFINHRRFRDNAVPCVVISVWPLPLYAQRIDEDEDDNNFRFTIYSNIQCIIIAKPLRQGEDASFFHNFPPVGRTRFSRLNE